MYVSMTGFSRTQIQRSWGTVSLEISSVNHRYQEIYVRLPREFSSWEPWFHQKLRKGFRRGKVQVRMEVLWAPAFKMGRINKDIMTSYCEELMQIQRMLGQAKDLQLESVVTLPGVLDIPRFEDTAEAEELETAFSELIEQGLSSWQKMRGTEGEHLKEDVLYHLSELERLSALIEDKWLPAREQAFENTRRKITEMLDSLGGKLEESRMMQEIAIMTDKWDVSEEIARMKSHITKFRSTGEDTESSGRKLDFIVQEMNREVNTLDSKISDAEIRWLAVDSKATLERVREQIQNLEQMIMNYRLVHVGFGNMVVADRIVAIISPSSAPIKRLKEEAREAGLLVDVTQGRKTRAILIMDSRHVIMSAIQPETITGRFEGEEGKEEKQ